MYALRDVFGRFGNLVEVYTLYGKNCGYVTYSTKESADEAIKVSHSIYYTLEIFSSCFEV